MAKLQNALAKKIPVWRDDIGKVLKKVGDKKMSEVTVRQSYGGMRGVKCMIDTSEVPPDKGLLVRNDLVGGFFDGHAGEFDSDGRDAVAHCVVAHHLLECVYRDDTNDEDERNRYGRGDEISAHVSSLACTAPRFYDRSPCTPSMSS